MSWSSVTGAEMYVATAGAADGHNQTCNSNGSTSCVFSDLQCGGGYSVTVRTVDRGCRSEPSAAVQVLTGEEEPVVMCQRPIDVQRPRVSFSSMSAH